MRRWSATLLFLLPILQPWKVMGSEAPSDTHSTNPLVTLSEGHLTVRAVDVPLSDLLQEIREKSHIQVELKDEEAAENRITVDLQNLPPNLALEQILRGLNLAYFYENDRLAKVVALPLASTPLPAKALSSPSPPETPPAQKKRELPNFEELLERDRAAALKAINEALASPDPEVRRAALEALEDDEEPDVVPILSRALRDPDPSIRMEALEALAERGELQLVKGALSDQNSEVREKAAELLEDAKIRSSLTK